MELHRCFQFLLPGAEYIIRGNDYASVEWLDARPMPTLAECEAAWVQIQAQDVADAAAAVTATANEATIGQQVEAALAANVIFLAIASPTNAQNAAQVKALTRQASGLIRLVRKKLDAAS